MFLALSDVIDTFVVAEKQHKKRVLSIRTNITISLTKNNSDI